MFNPFKNKKNTNTEDKFEPEIECICFYCENASNISAIDSKIENKNILCSIKGIVNGEYHCKKFIYDPLKRNPRVPPPISKLSDDDVI